MQRYHTHSSGETNTIGKKLGQAVVKKGAKKSAATVIALSGTLGAGKTTLIKGIYKGLGSKARVTSPTFIIMRRNALRGTGGFKNIFHIDAYRLASAEALVILGVKEILADPKNIILIEWSERVSKVIPSDAIKVSLHHTKEESERAVTITGIRP